MKWRSKWNKIVHRDLGYLRFGLTIIYVISGIAVNHLQDRNPPYAVERISGSVDLSNIDPRDDQALATAVLDQTGDTGRVKNSFRPYDSSLKIFVKNNTITLDTDNGSVFQEKSRNGRCSITLIACT